MALPWWTVPDLAQIEWEAVEVAHSEGMVEPEKIVRLLLLDAEEFSAVLNHLVEAGLLEPDGADFKLTAAGAARVEARHASESADAQRVTRAWQVR